MTELHPKVSRFCTYRRYLKSADFSLEANTDAAPEEGHFYLLRAGAVLLRTDDYGQAEAAYQGLCRTHWEGRLAAGSLADRMLCAWALLGLDDGHPDALAVIRQEGAAEDQVRLNRVRMKKASHRRLQARFPGRYQR
jgi:hypothetical protein